MARRVPRIGSLLALVVGVGLSTSACGAAEAAPELTVYADGTAIDLAPVLYCDVRVSACEPGGGGGDVLTARAGIPVQISVPGEVADSPWLVNVQAVAADGTVLPVRQEFFAPGRAFAYSARPARPDERIVVVEVQQLGVALAADQDGNLVLDEQGNPQRVARGVWTVAVRAPGHSS